MSQTSTDTSAEAIRSWLIERVAFYLERPESAIDPDARLVEIGLDSVYAMTLSGDVEERYGVEVEPTLAWDHPTVHALTTYLVTELKGR